MQSDKKNTFENILKKSVDELNKRAQENYDYYIKRNAQLLEPDILEVLKEKSIGTEFENTLKLVSGNKFPDIIAKFGFGVEVKSSKKDWTSIGNSVLESTRIPDVDFIYIIFGKLSNPIEFKFGLYEDCLTDIAVTHYPRYKINMEASNEETIFEKMNVPYNELYKMENPVEPIANYYETILKDGETLWWINSNVEESAQNPKIRLWKSLDIDEKRRIEGEILSLFPEVIGNGNKKYDGPTLWLMAKYSVVNTSMRDSFSAGGTVDLTLSRNTHNDVPQIFSKIYEYRENILEIINSDKELLEGASWYNDDNSYTINDWVKRAIDSTPQDKKGKYRNILNDIFNL